MRSYLILPALSLALAAATPALAVDRLNVPRDQWLDAVRNRPSPKSKVAIRVVARWRPSWSVA